MKFMAWNYQFEVDRTNLALILSLGTIGLAFIYSATHTASHTNPIYFQKQLIGWLVGLLIYVKLSNTDYRTLCRQGYFMYFLVIGLLIFTMIKGSIGMGAKRWINLGFIKFQPSELTKLFLPAYMAYELDGEITPSKLRRKFYQIFIVLIFSTLLVIKQPDLGTGLVILGSGLTLLWLSNIHHKFFKYLLILGALSAPIGWKLLRPYQKKRVEVFLGFGDQAREAYHINQSKIAIGSGQLFGKGYLAGTQNKFEFLPEGRTDFIFAVICEEIGLFGALMILLIYLTLFLRLLRKILALTTPAVQLLAVGLLIHIILSTIINICMVSGLLPVVGIPLPLVSYGVSNLWITLASLGWLEGIFNRSQL